MSAIQSLLTHIDLLRVQHRAGITPPAGHVEKLFDLQAEVRGELATGQLTHAPTPVASGTPPTAVLMVEIRDAAGQVLHRVPAQSLVAGGLHG